MKRGSGVLGMVLFLFFTGGMLSYAQEKSYVPLKIWDAAKHNAFTDIIKYNGQFYCTFRESSVGHIPGDTPGDGDGEVRVLSSQDGKEWRSVALLKRSPFDLRDAKLSLMPDGRLMVSMGGSIYNHGLQKRVSQVSFSDKQDHFSEPQDVIIDESIRTSTDWLWRVTWFQGTGYGVVYQLTGDDWEVWLIETQDGIHYKKVSQLAVTGCPNEATVRVKPNGEMWILIRREAGNGCAYLGKSMSPYTDWTWTDTGVSLGGPNFIFLPNGKVLAGGRVEGKTGLGFLTDEGKFQLFTTLPSDGDNSYPGFLVQDDLLYVSYYSSHEGKTAIYLVTIPLKDLE